MLAAMKEFPIFQSPPKLLSQSSPLGLIPREMTIEMEMAMGMMGMMMITAVIVLEGMMEA